MPELLTYCLHLSLLVKTIFYASFVSSTYMNVRINTVLKQKRTDVVVSNICNIYLNLNISVTCTKRWESICLGSEKRTSLFFSLFPPFSPLLPPFPLTPTLSLLWCVSPKLTCWNPNPKDDDISLLDRLVSWQWSPGEWDWWSQSSLGPPAREDRARRRQLGTRKRALEEHNHPGTLNLGFQNPQLSDTDFCCFEATQSEVFCYSSPNVLWHTIPPFLSGWGLAVI